jgi:hypothetical protein
MSVEEFCINRVTLGYGSFGVGLVCRSGARIAPQAVGFELIGRAFVFAFFELKRAPRAIVSAG